MSYVASNSFLFICLGYIVMYLFLSNNATTSILLFIFLAWSTNESYNFSQGITMPGVVIGSAHVLDLIVQGFGYVSGAVIAFGSKLLKNKLTERLEAKKSNTLSD